MLFALGTSFLLAAKMSMSRSFLDASIPELVEKLSLDEKISLLAGPNWWNTSAVERLEIPAVRMSDGPNVCYLRHVYRLLFAHI